MSGEEAIQKKKEYARAVCLFLADGLRSRRIPLQHAAEIGEKVVENINLIDTEEDFLKFIKSLACDFEELVRLEDRIFLQMKISEREALEAKVREYVVSMLQSDLAQSVQLLDEAVKDGSKLEELAQRFPKFKQFVESNGNVQPA